jgi:asparagine N-glycosylation enzyme membrane subunit Stt3
MERTKRILSAIIGYAGSSEAPQKMSLRLMGIITGVLSQFSPIIALVVSKVVTLPAGVTADAFIATLYPLIEIGTLVFAVVLYVVGLIRAGVSAYRMGGLGAFKI